MSTAERTYRLLLCAYPAAFRAKYGREMTLLFRDQRREPGARDVRFWAELLWDVARTAPTLRIEALRAQWDRDIRTGEGRMRTMAILAVLIGAAEAVNALAEGWAGGATNGSGFWLAGVILATVAGALLLAAGIAMLRQTPDAVLWARAAAITCLAVVVLIRLVQGWMSIFATLLGIVFPIALLLFMQWTRGRGPSAPTMA
jgi:hypothetical protein